MRKRGLGILLLAVLVAGAIYTTYALFSDSQTKKGVITTGTIKIGLYEKNAAGQPFEASNDPIMPGDTMEHVVTVKNEGNKLAWVRVKVAKKFVTPNDSLRDSDLDLLKVAYTGTWTAGTDGYYYYNKALAPAEESTPLFDTVSLDINADNRFKNLEFALDLQADGVQADNNGQTVSEAIGWPVD